ncbi:hypothetical protein D3C87_1848240 [compost metagenome]
MLKTVGVTLENGIDRVIDRNCASIADDFQHVVLFDRAHAAAIQRQLADLVARGDAIAAKSLIQPLPCGR